MLHPPGRAGVVPAASPATGCCKGQVLQLVATSPVAATPKAELATNAWLAAVTAGGTRLEGGRGRDVSLSGTWEPFRMKPLWLSLILIATGRDGLATEMATGLPMGCVPQTGSLEVANHAARC